MKNKESILKVLKYILTRPEKKRLILIFTGGLLLAFLETFSIGIIIPIASLFVSQAKIQTSRVLGWLYELSGAETNTAFLTLLIAIAIFIFFFKVAYSLFMLYLQRSTVNGIRVRLSTRLLSSYLKRPYAFHLGENSAVLFRNINTSVTHFSSTFLYALLQMASDILILLAVSCILIFTYPVITFLIGGILAVTVAVINLFLRKRIMSYSSRRLKSSEQSHKFGFEALHAVKDIKIYNAHDFFKERYRQATKNYADSVLNFHIAHGLPRYVLELVLSTSVLMLLLVSIYSNKGPADLIPAVMVFGFAVVRLLPLINRVYSGFNMVKYYSNTADIVYGALKSEGITELSSAGILSGDADVFGTSQSIRLENVDFRYRGARSPILKKFNLLVPKHKTIAIAGETGAGKSTLVDILMGLLTPDTGALYYGDTVVTPGNVSAYRKKIGHVPQHIFIIDDTVEANIAFAVPNDKIEKENLRKAIQIAQLESFISGLPSGIKTFVGERGIRLSGGQRQRIAIARALYHNPEVLIMDEATSALDGHTEAGLNRAIKNLCGKLTMIIIAHRLSTIEYADIIYVMDHGEIIDKGSFKELLEESDAFKKIANKIET